MVEYCLSFSNVFLYLQICKIKGGYHIKPCFQHFKCKQVYMLILHLNSWKFLLNNVIFAGKLLHKVFVLISETKESSVVLSNKTVDTIGLGTEYVREHLLKVYIYWNSWSEENKSNKSNNKTNSILSSG